MTNFIEIKTTFSNCSKGQKSMNEIIKILLQEKLSKCLQSTKIESHYIWPQDSEEINHEQEILLTIKAKKKNYDKIAKIISDNHQYDLPQIIYSDICGGDNKYLEWL